MITAEDVIAAAQKALDASGSMDIVYLHDSEASAPFAAIVRRDTPAWEGMIQAYEAEPQGMPPHDHIEPGMF